MFKEKPILYYIIRTFEGYVAKFEMDDGLRVQEKIARLQHDTIIYKGKLFDHSHAPLVQQEVAAANDRNKFNPLLLEQRLSETY